MRFVAIVVTGIIALPTLSAAHQAPTIPELVDRRRPDPVEIVRITEVLPPSLDDLVRSSTLVVRGTLRRLRTYLSEDQTTLLTDYEVLPRQRVARSGPAPTIKSPGTMRVIFTQWGGETTINGVEVVVAELSLRPFVDGSEVILFLREQGATGKFELVHDFAAAFDVTSNRVQPQLASPEQNHLARLRPDEFVAAIQKAATASPGPNRQVR